MTIKEFLQQGGSINVSWDQSDCYDNDSSNLKNKNIMNVQDLLRADMWKEPVVPDDKYFNEGSDYYTIYDANNIALADNLTDTEANEFIKNLKTLKWGKNYETKHYLKRHCWVAWTGC